MKEDALRCKLWWKQTIRAKKGFCCERASGAKATLEVKVLSLDTAIVYVCWNLVTERGILVGHSRESNLGFAFCA